VIPTNVFQEMPELIDSETEEDDFSNFNNGENQNSNYSRIIQRRNLLEKRKKKNKFKKKKKSDKQETSSLQPKLNFLIEKRVQRKTRRRRMVS